jgi:hypothetical protein
VPASVHATGANDVKRPVRPGIGVCRSATRIGAGE